VLLPDTVLPTAANMAEQVRQSVSKKAMKSKATGATLGKITMSFGVTCFDPKESPEEFVRRADQALYRAKSEGRNRVVSDPVPSGANPASRDGYRVL